MNLELLSLQANRIVKLENLDPLVNLTDLYISENGIEKIEGLDNNKLMETFDVAKNRITVIENVEHLENLEEFWVRKLQRRQTTITFFARLNFIIFMYFSGKFKSNCRLEMYR